MTFELPPGRLSALLETGHEVSAFLTESIQGQGRIGPFRKKVLKCELGLAEETQQPSHRGSVWLPNMWQQSINGWCTNHIIEKARRGAGRSGGAAVAIAFEAGSRDLWLSSSRRR